MGQRDPETVEFLGDLQFLFCQFILEVGEDRMAACRKAADQQRLQFFDEGESTVAMEYRQTKDGQSDRGDGCQIVDGHKAP